MLCFHKREMGSAPVSKSPACQRSLMHSPMWDPFEPENLTRNVIATPGCSPIQHNSSSLFVQCSAAVHNQCNMQRATGFKDMWVISGCVEKLVCPQGVLFELHSALFKLLGISPGSSSLPSTCKTFEPSHFHPFGAAAVSSVNAPTQTQQPFQLPIFLTNGFRTQKVVWIQTNTSIIICWIFFF